MSDFLVAIWNGISCSARDHNQCAAEHWRNLVVAGSPAVAASAVAAATVLLTSDFKIC